VALLIRYRSSDFEFTERTISQIEVEPPNHIHAYCHLREEGRSFALNRIERAVDLESGEDIADVWVYFGLPSMKSPRPKLPTFVGRETPMTTEEGQNLRKADKHALFRRFRFPVIARAARAGLWDLFDNKCFSCGFPDRLDLDHHVPQWLGGRLVPGNIVLLCPTCNAKKLDRHPSEFYTAERLAVLRPLLEAQLELFDFRFEWSQWIARPKEYLISLGVPAGIAEAALTDRSHPLYVGPRGEDE
jgi:HNH endonuclease